MDNLRNKNIAIIGAGHMGKALIQGLLQSGFPKENLLISNKAEDNKNSVQQADWVVLAVKPSLVQSVLKDIGEFIEDKLIISLAAALPIAKIVSYTRNPKQKVIRLMPNIPVAFNKGVIGIYVNTEVSEIEKQQVSKCFLELGNVFFCKNEDDLDAITVISGCGPAIASYCISMLAQAGEKYGLSKETAEKIAIHTFEGTIQYLNQTHQTASELQSSVATKGGVTEQIITSLDKHHLPDRFEESLKVGYDKIKSLKEEL